ncbi:MAG: peptide chain release factor N(5)-glutamine methyltransferase [Dehalococcoidia bacterium]|nr:peptide chain release factor N(5)-glutamine methyltransferase [Dehalococcoidia bacterium]
MNPAGDRSGHPIRELIERTRARLKCAGIAEYQLEGELLLQHVMKISPARMFAGMNDTLEPGTEAELQRLTERRADREPLAYITGRRAFYGRELNVTPEVLIPRGETELLVDLALKWVADHPAVQADLQLADIGTGCGTLAITLAAELSRASVDAVDISPAALEVALGNAQDHGVSDRVNFFEGDLASPLKGRRYRLVLANLPYVRADSLATAQPEVRREPVLALLGGADGLDLVRRLATTLPELLDPTGSLALFEIDPLTAAGTVEILEAALPAARVTIVNDLAGLERCVTAEIG